MEDNLYKNNNVDQIDLNQLLKLVLKQRKIVIKWIVVFAIIGLFVAVFSKKEYTSSTILLPQINSSKPGGIGGLAALAGIDVKSVAQDDISPYLYPNIVSSIPFKKKLVQTQLTFNGVAEKVSYLDYYKEIHSPGLLFTVKKYTIGLPKLILGLFKGKKIEAVEVVNDSIYRISKFEYDLFNAINDQLSIELKPDVGVISIKYSMPEALAAAQMTKAVKELLQKEIVRLKTKKIKQDLEFIQKRHQELKSEFHKKQISLASFRDKNKGLILSRSQTRLERLRSEYNLAYELYSDFSKQLENQKIKLKENTPIFRTIEPVSVPVDRSKPKRTLIIIIWTFLGFIFGLGSIFIKRWILNFKN